MKTDAEKFSREGDKYLGRSYDEMDCQKFVEKCMADAGLKMDLAGSNAWYREVMKNGWCGSPEECVKRFGSVPKGALLFILENDGKEPAKYQGDGIGNASHIGIKTGRGDGAIHSSHSKGCVCQSKFKDNTIPNGGWNRVGLYNRFTYGEGIDAILAGKGSGGEGGNQNDSGEDETVYEAILAGGNVDKPINIRVKPEGDLKDTLPQGSRVTVLSEEGNWCKIQYGKKTGYVKGEFVTVADDGDEPVADDSGIPEEDFGDDFGDDDDDEPGDDEKVIITLSAKEAANALPALKKLVDAIINQAGRG